MTRGYDWDGKEFLCTGVSIKFNNEAGKITVEVEGEASTWGPDGVAGPYPAQPPHDDPPADNPSEYWPDWPPGITPEEPDGDPPPWVDDTDAYLGMLVYFVLFTGHLIRGTGLGYGLIPTYSYLGDVSADAVVWMALDRFDPTNKAMICSQRRVYRTENLSADIPDWEVVLGPFDTPYVELGMVRSSSVQQDLWMVVGHEGLGAGNLYVWWSETGGDTWNFTTFRVWDSDGAYWPSLEMSTHDADRAWAMWRDVIDDRTYIAYTDDMWATAPTITFIPQTCFDEGNSPRPICHHRQYNNDDDSESLFGGVDYDWVGGSQYARVYRNGVCSNLLEDPTRAGTCRTRMVGCGVGTYNRWWAIAMGLNEEGFFVSDDQGSWTEQKNWDRTGVGRRHWDCKNFRAYWKWYAMTNDGPTTPVMISIDRGETWDDQSGNWIPLLLDEGLPADPDVWCICSPSLLP